MDPSVAQRFELGPLLGRGGSGTVCRARDRATGAELALKRLGLLDDAARARFAREAAVLATLDHPAIVRYLGHGDDWLAMEWIDGETVDRRMGRGVSVDEACAIVRRLAVALDHAHARGIVHRDVKPANVILRGGRVEDAVLVDFGVARSAGGYSAMTATGTVVGSPGYLSPEQARGQRTIGPASDVFALGCVLYELCTGRAAFEGQHPLALVAKAVVWEPQPPRALRPSLPDALDALIRAMLAKHPDDRPTMARIADGLTGHDTDGGATAPTSTASCLVIASSSGVADGVGDPLDPDELDALADTLVAAAPDQIVEVLLDGTIVALTDDVAQALRVAQAVALSRPSWLVTIASASTGAATQVIEPAIGALAREALVGAFAGGRAARRPAGAVRLDEPTAARVEPVVRVDGVPYWVPGTGA